MEDAPAEYGDEFADIYDLWHREDVTECIATLAGLVEGKSILDLGVGTGRIALPLAAKGFRVCGVDSSEKMLNKLREKRNAEEIALVRGNLADVPVEGQFDLIYAVGWSFSYLLSQSDQIRCFRNVSRTLSARGLFVVETVMPGEWIFKGGSGTSFTDLIPGTIGLHFINADTTRAVVEFIKIIIAQKKEMTSYVERFRLIWPSELDLLAEMAGLRLVDRWGSWKRSPLIMGSSLQIATYALKG